MDRSRSERQGRGRVWYLIDGAGKTIWVTLVAAGHPKRSERRNRN